MDRKRDGGQKKQSVAHIALAFGVTRAHMRMVVLGIEEYARKETGWLLTTGGESATLSVEQLKGWKGSGIIAALVSESEVNAARAFMRRGIPVVTITGAIVRPAGICRVTLKNREIGKMAGEHLLSRGYERFAFYGLKGVWYSQERLVGYSHAVQGSGEVKTYLSPNTFGRHRQWQDEVEGIRQWLSEIKTPVGLFAVNDYRARLTMDACKLLGLKIPEQVGILGMDNDRVLCEFSDPMLSSIECDWKRVGIEAARTLHQLMKGEKPAEDDQQIGPVEVVPRSSTNVTIVKDEALSRSVNYIRDHLDEAYGVERLLTVSGVSRRKLEKAFITELGMSPYRYLCGKRLEHAKFLLAKNPSIRLNEVSKLCGFNDPRRFRLVFSRMEGMKPGEYRKSRAKAKEIF